MLGHISTEYFDFETDYVPYEEREPIDRYLTVLLNDINKKCINAYMNYNFLEVSSSLTTFMTNYLSSFYLDYIKDIVYIELPNSKRRRQVQSVLYDLVDCLVRLWAPILSFTTEEIWSNYKHEQVKSVHLLSFTPEKQLDQAEYLKDNFARLIMIRDDVNKAIENMRSQKTIGKSLEAKVSLEVSTQDQQLISELLDDNLTQFLIVSAAHLDTNTDYDKYEVSKVKISKAEGQVCPRCWNISDKSDEDGLCPRCHQIIESLI